MKTKIVRDVPIGVLLIVLAMYAAYAVVLLTENPPTIHIIAIFALCFVTNKLVTVGMDLIQGIEIADKND